MLGTWQKKSKPPGDTHDKVTPNSTLVEASRLLEFGFLERISCHTPSFRTASAHSKLLCTHKRIPNRSTHSTIMVRRQRGT